MEIENPFKKKKKHGYDRIKVIRDIATCLNRYLLPGQIAKKHGISRMMVHQYAKKLRYEGCAIPKRTNFKIGKITTAIKIYKQNHPWQFNNSRDKKYVRHTNCLVCGFGYQMDPHSKAGYSWPQLGYHYPKKVKSFQGAYPSKMKRAERFKRKKRETI